MYTIGQVEEITGVKQHVLRYWEEVIPGFAPKKDFGGRRLYSQKDMETVLRLKHLIYQKKFTIEGARDQIINESEAFEKSADLLGELRAARRELTEAFFALRKLK
ncbi:MAG: MerR family transcriptional regulator [Treponema sp.]|nr:MerR family transcriptional regulator [Treponema sp.]